MICCYTPKIISKYALNVSAGSEGALALAYNKSIFHKKTNILWGDGYPLKRGRKMLGERREGVKCEFMHNYMA